MTSSRRRVTEPSAVELIEEAVHLLRRAPVMVWVLYYVGAVPFVLAGLFFWAHTTWFRPSGAVVAWGALGLTILFVAMKAFQAEFCAHLFAFRLGVPPPRWTGRRFGRIAFAQLQLQPWALFALGMASVAAFPFGWVYAYGQVATVLGDEAPLHSTALSQAKLWPMQNHLGLALLAGIGFCVEINLGATFVGIPWLANHLLGIDNVFGLSGWSVLNTTVLAAVTGVTWLVVDPLVKAFYTLWVFHGRARRTGEDVRVEFDLARRAKPLGVGAAALLAILALTGPANRANAADTRPVVTAGNLQRAPELNRAIDETLAGPDFAWRLRPLPGKADDEQREGPVARFFREGWNTMSGALRSVRQAISRGIDWIDRHFQPRSTPVTQSGSTGWGREAVRLLLYLFIALAILVILWLVWIIWRQARRTVPDAVAAQPVSTAAPDLADENVEAAQLPSDGWLELAREQIQRGEWRLALRALYLATLARLAGEGLISLARFKTNLDYERELRRRALSRTEVVVRFTSRRRTFEAVWYGRVAAGENDVRTWMAELERPGSL